MRSLRLTVDGEAVTLTPLPASLVPQPTSGSATAMGAMQLLVVPLSGGGDPLQELQAGTAAQAGGSAPALSNDPADVTLDSTSSSQSFELDWTDPNSMRPGFCFVPWDVDAQRPYPHCVYCVDGKVDGLASGTTHFDAREIKAVGKIDFGYGTSGPDACRGPAAPMMGGLRAGAPRGLGFTPPGANAPAMESPCKKALPAGSCFSDNFPTDCVIGTMKMTQGPTTGFFTQCDVRANAGSPGYITVGGAALGGDPASSFSANVPASGAGECSQDILLNVTVTGTVNGNGFAYQAGGTPSGSGATEPSCSGSSDPLCNSCSMSPTGAISATHWAGTIKEHGTNTVMTTADITVEVDVARYPY